MASTPCWDSPDGAWAELDASRITRTFMASFRDPTQETPNNSPKKGQSALSRVTDALTSLLSLNHGNTSHEEASEEEEETTQDKLRKLQNPYYTSPSYDVCDSIMHPLFLSGSYFFPASPSPRHMHVINLAAYFGSQDPLVQAASPRLCDAVATVLSHTDVSCIEAFLDAKVKEFVYKREVENRKGGNVVIIRREGSQIVAGLYRDAGFSLQWSLYVRAGFNAVGRWFEEYAAAAPGVTPVVHGMVRWNKFTLLQTTSAEARVAGELHRSACEDGSGKTVGDELRRIPLSEWKKRNGDGGECEGVCPYDPKFALYQSRVLARYLVWDIWVRLEGRYDCRAWWEADEEVNEVRLKRSLIGFGRDRD